MSKAHINTRTLGASLASRLISEAKHVPSQMICFYFNFFLRVICSKFGCFDGFKIVNVNEVEVAIVKECIF